MKSFIQYLQEGSMLTPLALTAGILAGGGQAQAPATQTTQTTQTTQAAAPVVDPYAHFGGAHNVNYIRLLLLENTEKLILEML